jgi:glutamate dehydrogenase
MCKNSIIVPTGAKGGFVLTGKLNVCDRDKIQQEAILAYKTLLSGMLDLTDNINDKDTIKPANTICYDEDSPYLVVAADKGTSTFSDIANTVSCERGFWLGDAFASGGSVGYDHKKIGITARGAWFSLDRHCKEAGIDLNDSFTVIGIGDMSGDVFGNAMLLSNKIKLVAAFDHRHIFMDPDPDPEASYKERSRLFKLPRSSWIDYDRSVLSANGGIFERESKRILLNESMQDILGISDIEISGEQLIQAILKAPVDIFWNGGIGTYVKASTESNEQVGDKTNDAVRINACDLRCKVVVEGGNLGFTQKARIEYAQKGGFINTDAIDNSAGVDCSDHEVNIKIALSLAVTQGKISIKERDNILREMTEEVANNVYQDNRLQNQSITIEQKEVTTNMFLYSELMDVLEHEGILRRDIEYLPNKQTMIQRMNCGNVLTRPELAVLLSYSKMSLSRKIANCNLTQFDGLVMSYFPQRMRESFANKIKAHPLKNDIIATIMTNDIVHHLGINYCNIELSNEPAINIVDLVHMYIAVREIFDLKQIWQNIEDLSMSVGNSNVFNTQVKLFYEVRRFAQRAVSWMMRNMHNKISDMVSIKVGVESFFANIDKILPDDLSLFYQGRFYTYKSLTIADDLANKMAKLDLMRYSYGLLKLSTFLRKNMVEAAKVHFAIADVLQLKWLYDNLEDMCINDYWTRITVSGLRDDLTYIHRKLTEHIVVARKEKNTSEAITAWLETLETNFIAYKEIIKEIQEQAKIDINMLSTAIHKLRPLLPASVRNNT